MRVRYLAVLLVLLFALSACSRGPDVSTLETALRQRLDQQFSEDLFRLVELDRKGTAPRLDGVDGIYAYYNLELEFLRDYNLISRDNLNVGTLAVVLGATPRSIEGFDSSGNSKGDRLLVRGRLGFQQLEGTWAVNTFTPLQPEATPAVAETLDTPAPRAIIADIRALLEHDAQATRSEQDLVTLRELRRALARIDLGHADLDDYHTLGTGWPSGSYYQFGEAFAAYANKQGFRVFNYESEGSLENGYRLNSSRIDFALLQSDVAEVLYKGWVEQGQLPSPDLRAIASLWPEAIHVITLEQSGLRVFSDLEGKRIAIGSELSGTRFTAARIWKAAGFRRMDNKNVRLLGRGNSIKALENGEVDAIIIAGAIPDPGLQDLAQRRDDIRFIPLGQATIDKLVEQNFAYYAIPIPAKTYPGQTEPVVTLGMAALLATNVRIPDEDVEQFMTLLRDGSEEISRSYFRAGFITDKTVRLGISMPLHPGAEKFYARIRQASPEIPDKQKGPVDSPALSGTDK